MWGSGHKLSQIKESGTAKPVMLGNENAGAREALGYTAHTVKLVCSESSNSNL
jgi:hypothetical protein